MLVYFMLEAWRKFGHPGSNIVDDFRSFDDRVKCEPFDAVVDEERDGQVVDDHSIVGNGR
jgi:hypothetical protein